MLQKLFVLGLPGSGKSTAARHIQMLARDHRWIASHFNDYGILRQMFLDDKEGKRFSSTQYNGFDIHDHTAFDDALNVLGNQVLQKEKVTSENNELVIVEFARDDYCRDLKLFFPQLLPGAYFLFIDADISSCKERIQKRVADPRTLDDHFVSTYIFESYYQRDNKQYLTSVAAELKENCHITDERIQVIDNTGKSSLQGFLEEISLFIMPLLKKSAPEPEPAQVNNQLKG